MNLPTLYHRSKSGAIVEWTVSTNLNTLTVSWGQMGGAIQTTSKLIEGKNLGKKNATSHTQQAELEAQSLWNHKRDREKYALTPEAATEIVLLPMLAHTFKPGQKLNYSVLIQPKLDGLRMMALSDGTLLSRKGKEYDVAHISEAVKALNLPENIVLDGEIYLHGTSLQQINSLVKKPKPGSEKLEYWLFDLIDLSQSDLPTYNRLDLNFFFLHKSENITQKCIKNTPFMRASSEADINEFHNSFVEQGFEGIIIRDPAAPYELGHRSRGLLKFKNFIDDEFEIVGYKSGEGRYEGCVTWICKLPNGDTVDCTPRGTVEQKRQWYKDAASYVGRKLTIRFQSYTPSGSLEFPVGIAIRLEEDVPE